MAFYKLPLAFCPESAGPGECGFGEARRLEDKLEGHLSVVDNLIKVTCLNVGPSAAGGISQAADSVRCHVLCSESEVKQKIRLFGNSINTIISAIDKEKYRYQLRLLLATARWLLAISLKQIHVGNFLLALFANGMAFFWVHPILLSYWASFALSLSSKGLSAGAADRGRLLRVLFIGDFLCSDSPDPAVVDALETISLVGDLLAVQLGEWDLPAALAHVHNFHPHLLIYSTGACRPDADHSLALLLLNHVMSLGARTLALVLRCPDAAFMADTAPGFWKADPVLVDGWAASPAAERWRQAGVRTAWLGHGVASRHCREAAEAAESAEDAGGGARGAGTVVMLTDWPLTPAAAAGDACRNATASGDGEAFPGWRATAEFLRRAYGARFRIVERRRGAEVLGRGGAVVRPRRAHTHARKHARMLARTHEHARKQHARIHDAHMHAHARAHACTHARVHMHARTYVRTRRHFPTHPPSHHPLIDTGTYMRTDTQTHRQTHTDTLKTHTDTYIYTQPSHLSTNNNPPTYTSNHLPHPPPPPPHQ